MKKRILAIIMTIAMAVCYMPNMALQVHGADGDTYYVAVGDTVTVTGTKYGTSANFTIDSQCANFLKKEDNNNKIAYFEGVQVGTGTVTRSYHYLDVKGTEQMTLHVVDIILNYIPSELLIDETKEFTVALSAPEGVDFAVTEVTSSNPDCVTVEPSVDNKYKLTGHSGGNATITINTTVGVKKTFDVAVPEIVLDKTETEISAGSTVTINAETINTEINASCWSLSEGGNSVVQMSPSEDGKSCTVKGLARGEVTVNVVSRDGKASAACEVTVGTPAPAMTITGESNAEGKVDFGQKVEYTVTVTNTGNVSLTGIKVEADKAVFADGANIIDPLDVGESADVSCTYIVTEADILAAEDIVNKVSAEGSCPEGMGIDPPAKAETTINVTPKDQKGELTVQMSSNYTGNQTVEAGSEVTYTITVANSGNVTISNMIAVDERTGNGGENPMQLDKTALAPGKTATAATIYKASENDMLKLFLKNKAIVTGNTPDGVVPRTVEAVSEEVRIGTFHVEDFGDPIYVWDKNLTKCLAFRTCRDEDCRYRESETVETRVDGNRIIAEFNNEYFETQTKIIAEHEHTFSVDWSYNEKVHWHAATCGCTDVVDGFARHTWIPGEDGDVCETCGCTRSDAEHVHSLEAVAGKPATCTEDGYAGCFRCTDERCGKCFEDPACEIEIEDYDSWKTGDGKISKIDHSTVMIPQQDATIDDFGVKPYWYCTGCKTYFADNEGSLGSEIGDAEALETWKSGEGQIPKVAPHVHSYGEPVYLWNENLGKCIAYKRCECTSAVIETVVPTISGNEYVAEFSSEFETQRKPVVTHEHEYGEAKYVWNQDLSKCLAYKRCDCGVAVIEQVDTSIEDGMCVADFSDAFTDQTISAGGVEHVHSPTVVDGKAAACTEDGYSICFRCTGKDCDKYFEDPACEKEIEDYNNWKTGAGKIEKTGHSAVKIPLQNATSDQGGVKAYWYCTSCKLYFEDKDGSLGTEIGDEAAFETWKSNDGGIEKTVPAHEHTFASDWSKNGEYHWHAATCEHKDVTSGHAKHNYNAGTISKGIKTYTCQTCGYQKTEKLSVTVPKTSIKSVKRAKKAFTAKWTMKSVTGYQIQYARNSKFTKSTKTVTVQSASAVSKKIKSLKKKKRYYVRVRCYINKYDTTYYSGWSAKKSVKTK